MSRGRVAPTAAGSRRPVRSTQPSTPTATTSSCTVTDRLSFTVRFEPNNTSTARTVNYTHAPEHRCVPHPGLQDERDTSRDQIGTTHIGAMSSTTDSVTVHHAPLRGQRSTDNIETSTRLYGVLEDVGSYTTAAGKCSNAPTPTCHF